MTAPLLELRGVTKRFGGVLAVAEVDLAVPAGAALGIIGPNGAGKSTLLALMAGAIPPTEGVVLYGGQDLRRMPRHAVARAGIARTFQVPRPFRRMTVRENLELARLATRRLEPSGVDRILALTGLKPIERVAAGDLGLLALKRLELARALATEPEVLLLDEIGAGLTDEELRQLTHIVRELRGLGKTVVIVEHIVSFIRELVDTLVVMDMGRKVIEGPPEQVVAHELVQRAYFGGAGRASPQRPSPPPRPRSGAAQAALRVEDLQVAYGHIRALQGVSLTVGEGELAAVLGLNGAGKSTLCKAVVGLVRPTAGRIAVFGRDTTGRNPAELIREHRVALCPEGRHVLRNATVLDNLLLAGEASRGLGREGLERVFALFPRLKERVRNRAGTLSGGEQQMLAVARALMADPRLLIVDEASLGLTPEIMERIWEVLVELRRGGLTLVIVEQRVPEILEQADRVYVLDRGKVAFHGTPAEMRASDTLSGLLTKLAEA